jgi:hypothetical protein
MRSIGVYTSSITKDKASRTTIPLPVVQAFGLVHKDKILWELFVGENGEIFATVKKKGSSKRS